MHRTPTPEAFRKVPDADDLAPGTLIGGRYRVRRSIGRGGAGVVYEAEHVRVERPVAIKLMDRRASLNETARRHFQKEARAASAAGHPGIVEIFDAGETPDGRPYLVMELLRGQSLADLLESGVTLSVERACTIVRDVSRALQAAHDVGVIHRDLKPENIFLAETKTGEVVKVLDFGIAFEISESERRLTGPGLAVGTPDYMAPEQSRGAPGAPATDVYALGVILYEILTGVTPFSHCSVVEVITKKLVDRAPPIETHRSDIPPRLEELIEACLEIDPDKRPPSAAAVADALDAILTTPEPARSVVVSRASRPVLVGAVAVGVVGVLGLSTWALGTPGASDPPSTADAVEASKTAVVTPDPMEPVDAPPLRPEPAEPRGPDAAPVRTTATDLAEAPEPSADELTPSVDEPDPAPTRPGKASVERHRTAECGRTRKRAEEAREAHDWSLLRRLAGQTRCWPSKNEPQKLRVLAYMNLGEFENCVEAGKQVADSQVRKWVALCRKRLDGGGA